ncbi:MAG: RagB/SusD family nutrient uptake outer membrane protein, partial [Bacteroidia bacterium]|nr:RagB/SusD family nutrient uptake outer membrane protein [Bacteroidia bacterium]
QFDGDKTSTRPFLLRFTDIAMTYAEAAGPTGEAYQVMNFIRQRAGLGNLPPDLPLEEFRERVYRERIYEMAYEADRMYDIRRWGRIGEIKEVVDAGLTESQYSFYPIPQSEINLNPSLR